MKTPFFSIITCTYNSDKYLEKNILSIEKQNFTNFEHIFIDGFSTDGTLEIIKKYQAKYPNQVKLFQFKPEGISNAMNQGIEESSGEYLIHLHSDDQLYDDNVLKDVVNFLEQSNFPDWIYGKINVVKDGKNLGTFPNKKIWQRIEGDALKNYLLKFNNYIPHQAVFIKKTVFEQLGNFDESLTSGMDPDLWLRIRNKTRWFYFNRIISNYSIRADAQSSGTKTRAENLNNHLIVQKRHLNFFELIVARIVSSIIKSKKSQY